MYVFLHSLRVVRQSCVFTFQRSYFGTPFGTTYTFTISIYDCIDGFSAREVAPGSNLYWCVEEGEEILVEVTTEDEDDVPSGIITPAVAGLDVAEGPAPPAPATEEPATSAPSDMIECPGSGYQESNYLFSAM